MLAHPFEARIAVAALVVVASAVVGYDVGGRVIAAGNDAPAEALGDVIAHAEHAFAFEAPEGVDVASGELIAQYAPVSIDALPVHHAAGDELELAIAEEPPVASIASGSADELLLVTRGEIGKGESLASSLRRQGIKPAAIHLISTELRKVFDFRKSRAADVYRLVQDPDGRVLDFEYSQGRGESYTLAWKGTRYVASRQAEKLEAHVAKIAGVVDGSFYDAITSLGEQSALATEFARILAWDMDFTRSVRPGDEFALLYERLYAEGPDGKSVYVRPGKILAGRYSGQTGEHTVVYYENGDGEGAYFRPDGTSIERAFLAAPLEFSRITSRFTNARRHPILNITRPHPGIDYAAPYGTPIFAVGDGIVEFRGRQGGNGNFVRIRHHGGYTSHYAHLSRFANGLNPGDRVKQKQIIGYVGSTGLSTGPHVCFRMKKHGHYVDPLKIGKPAGPAIDYDRIDHFRDVRDQRLADLGRGPFVAANEAL
ncbi:MAG: peptidoglycan DD-metalloendopeptidase family protein [Myxococcota bacterium]